MLRNTHDLPPEGFWTYSAETNWTSPKYIGLEDAAKAVQQHRAANTRFGWATDLDSCRQFVLDFTEARLKSMPGGDQWLLPGSTSPPPDFLLRPRPVRRAPAVVGETGIVKKAAAGIGAVVSWLGSGLKTVDQETANRRAEICSTCDRNQRLEGMEKSIGTVGHILHSIAEAKREMKLATPFDEKLHQCASCLCSLPTKIWAPTDHIKQGTTKEIFDSLAPQCWIRKELTGNEPLG